MIISDMDMIAQDMVCIAERADGKGKVEGYYFCLHHNDERTHVHHMLIPVGADLSLGTPIEKIQVEVIPESITLIAQKPRVMTLEEAQKWVEIPLESRDPVFYEDRTLERAWWIWNVDDRRTYLPAIIGGIGRFWTSRPTDEQREKVKWK